MALQIQHLIDGFTDMTVNFAASPTEAAIKMSTMYGNYAVNAQTPVGGVANAASVLSATAILKNALIPIFTNSKEAATTASGMNSAFSAFWGTIIFSPSIIPPAIITGGAILESKLGGMGPTMNSETAVNLLAEGFNSFTKSIQVTCPGAPPVIGFLS
jgi:hypothetical protein